MSVLEIFGIERKSRIDDPDVVIARKGDEVRKLFEPVPDLPGTLRDHNHQRKLGAPTAGHKIEVLRYDCVWNPFAIGGQRQTRTALSIPDKF